MYVISSCFYHKFAKIQLSKLVIFFWTQCFGESGIKFAELWQYQIWQMKWNPKILFLISLMFLNRKCTRIRYLKFYFYKNVYEGKDTGTYTLRMTLTSTPCPALLWRTKDLLPLPTSVWDTFQQPFWNKDLLTHSSIHTYIYPGPKLLYFYARAERVSFQPITEFDSWRCRS